LLSFRDKERQPGQQNKKNYQQVGIKLMACEKSQQHTDNY